MSKSDESEKRVSAALSADRGASVAERIAQLTPEERAELLGALTEEQRAALLEDWHFWARPVQLPPPGAWWTWVLTGGRGSGKTKSGAEYIHWRVNQTGVRYVNLISRTAADYRDVMVGGESGLLATAKKSNPCEFVSTRRLVRWANGAEGLCFSSEEPDSLRGPQSEVTWLDELSAFSMIPDSVGNTVFTNATLGTRLGKDPRMIVTMTPKPVPIVKELLSSHRQLENGGDVVVTRMSLYDNISNLPPSFIREVLDRYEGTRLGKQEIMGFLLEDVLGALWDQHLLDRDRRASVADDAHDFIVVGVDPAVTNKATSAETGIVVVGRQRKLEPDTGGRLVRHVDVLGDYSMRGSPEQWAAEVVRVYHTRKADLVVAEQNQGYELVRSVLANADPTVPVELVSAARGKRTRAEPVAQLSEQGRLHLVGQFGDLEGQLCSWVPGDVSPDRLDAMCWAVHRLLLDLSSPPGKVHTGAGHRVRVGVGAAVASRRLHVVS